MEKHISLMGRIHLPGHVISDVGTVKRVETAVTEILIHKIDSQDRILAIG